MTITLDDLEANIWQFAIESTPERMDDLRRQITTYRSARQPARQTAPPAEKAEQVAVPLPETAEPPAEVEAETAYAALHLPDDDFQKTCSGCKKTMIASYDPERTAFSRDRGTKDKFRYKCKDCERKRRRAVSQTSAR